MLAAPSASIAALSSGSMAFRSASKVSRREISSALSAFTRSFNFSLVSDRRISIFWTGVIFCISWVIVLTVNQVPVSRFHNPNFGVFIERRQVLFPITKAARIRGTFWTYL